MVTPDATAKHIKAALIASGRVCPVWGIVLGTGIKPLADGVENPLTIPYADLPGFPPATAPGHDGRLVLGAWHGVSVAMLSGRAHGYEGHTNEGVTFAVRTLAALGIRNLVLTNASGGLVASLTPGDVVLIDDHLDWLRFRRGWWSGRLLEQRAEAVGSRPWWLGPGRTPYDRAFVECVERAARRQAIRLTRGTYVAVPGPNYETRAEYRAFRRIGGTVVGMSTVPEVQAARAVGLRVAAMSVVGNVALPDVVAPPPTTTEQVEAAAERGAATLEALVRALLTESVAEPGLGDAIGSPRPDA